MGYDILIFPVLGVVAGIIAGLLGLGGGIVIVPVLIATFTYLQYSPDVLTHMAVGTSLATIVITSFGSVRQHHRNGAVRWDILRSFAVGLVLGALLGSVFADRVDGRVLQQLFGAFSIIVAVQMFIGFKPNATRELPTGTGLFGVGTLFGSIASIFGIGGGSLTVPFLTWCNVKMQHAVGTSSAAGMPIALAGAVGFMIQGWKHPQLPPFSLGYINLVALFGIGITSVIFSQVGARWAHRLPAATLKRYFSFVLVVVGIKLIMG